MYFAKNVANSILPYNYWLSFQRLCRIYGDILGDDLCELHFNDYFLQIGTLVGKLADANVKVSKVST